MPFETEDIYKEPITDYLTEEEFRSHKMRLIGKYIDIKGIAGVGKTTENIKLIRGYLHLNYKVLLITHNHKLIRDILKEHKDIDWIKNHEYEIALGKEQNDEFNRPLCKFPKKRVYLHKCYKCKYHFNPYNKCLFVKKWERIDNLIMDAKPCVVMTVSQLLNPIGIKMKDFVIICDESVDNFINAIYDIPDRFIKDNLLIFKSLYQKQKENPNIKVCPFSCTTKETTNCFNCNHFEVYGTPEFIEIINKIKPIDEEEYFFYQEIKNKRIILCRKLEYHKGNNVRYLVPIPHEFNWKKIQPKQFIYTDATSSVKSAEETLGLKFDQIIIIEKELKNKVIQLYSSGTIDDMSKRLEYIQEILQLCNFPDNKETLIVCKDMFKKDLMEMTKCYICNHEEGIGTNDYEDCNNVLLYGKIRFNETQKILYHESRNKYRKTWNESKSDIEQKEKAIVIQNATRIRPYADSSKVIAYMFKDTYKELMPTITIKNINQILKMLKEKEKYQNCNRTEIIKNLRTSWELINKIIEELEIMELIEPINHRRDILIWIR